MINPIPSPAFLQHYAIGGVVCDYDNPYGVPTPVNEMAVKVVKYIEAGKRNYDFVNLQTSEQVIGA